MCNCLVICSLVPLQSSGTIFSNARKLAHTCSDIDGSVAAAIFFAFVDDVVDTAVVHGPKPSEQESACAIEWVDRRTHTRTRLSQSHQSIT